MHTLHYYFVEAPSKEEAFSEVSALLEPSDDTGYRMAEWSDWHVVGGGRWNPIGDGYTPNDSQVISYATEPDKFNNLIEQIKSWRIDNMNRAIKEINTDKFISDMVDYISNSGIPDNQRFSMNTYAIKNACESLMDFYTSDSHFFDCVEHTSHMKYLMERLDNPEKAMLQYIVPVDFHY